MNQTLDCLTLYINETRLSYRKFSFDYTLITLGSLAYCRLMKHHLTQHDLNLPNLNDPD